MYLIKRSLILFKLIEAYLNVAQRKDYILYIDINIYLYNFIKYIHTTPIDGRVSSVGDHITMATGQGCHP